MRKCLDDYQKHVDEAMHMQDLLSLINESNLESTINDIKSSIFYLDKQNMKILLKSINIFFKIRRSQMICYFRLIEELLPKILELFTKEEIMDLLKKKEIHLKLHKNKIITAEDIASFYGIKSLNLGFFYPEMTSLFSKYPSLEENIKDSNQYEFFHNLFSQKVDTENDPRFQVGNTDQLSISIRNDDIDLFQSIVSKNNINIRNYKLSISKFEKNKCLNFDQIYLIEYASFYGSIKIFKFLQMNNAPFTNSFLQYAICGGNHEIVHLVEKSINGQLKEQEMEKILNLSIIFHRYELTEYLIDFYNMKIQYDDFLMSIFYNNYNFFINHIVEFDEEYNKLRAIKETSYISEDENRKLKEFIEKINEFLLLSAGNVDIFFLKILINFKDIDFNQVYEPDAKNLSSSNPLVLAIQSRNNENAKFLLSMQPVDPDCVLAYKTTPFTWACYVGDLEIAKYLVDNYYYNKKDDKSIDIFRIIDESGENSLHLATRQSNLEMVKYLVSLNLFDLSAKNIQGETAIQTAARLGYKEIFDFLKSALINSGIEIDEDLTVNNERYLPSQYIKPLAMSFSMFTNLKKPISQLRS